MREHLLGTAILFLIVGLFFPRPISAQLQFENLIYDGQGQPQLGNATAVAVSPDGNHAYASSYNDDALNVYSRNVITGNLTFITALTNGQNGVSGLGGAYSVVVSPDGNHVYTAGAVDNAVAVFERNVSTGELSFITSYKDNVNGIDGLAGAVYVGLSPDGNNLYAIGPDDNAIVIFKRNVVDGSLTYLGLQQDNNGIVDAMGYPVAHSVSPDGQFVYVISYDDVAITTFARNTQTGNLTFVSAAINGQNGVSGLEGAYGIHVSADGKSVYATGSDFGTVVAFSRDAGNGSLFFLEMHQDDLLGVDGIGGALNVTSSADGNYVYVVGAYDEAIAIFNRDSGTGTLTYETMLQNGIDADGLSYPVSMTLSGDGQNVYAAGFYSDAIVVFDRNDNNGSLNFTYKEAAGLDGIDGLGGANAVAVSPNGQNVYVTGNGDNGMAVFSRNTNTGVLTFDESHKDGNDGVDGLKGANWVSVSPDGKNVYTTGFWDHSLSVFSRNETTGALTFMEFKKDNNNGVDGLNGANCVVVSPDGNNVYSTAYWEHSLAVFSRAADGSLTYMTRFKDGTSGVDGLSRASAVAIAPDGKNVYVSSTFDNAVAIFNRDVNDGSLVYIGMHKDGVGGVDGLRGASGLAVSPDGEQVIVAGPNDNAIAVFDRNTTDGTLTFAEVIQNGVDDIGGLDKVSRVAYAPFGSHVYTTSPNENAVVVFKRNTNTNALTFEKMRMNGLDEVSGIDGASGLALSENGRHIYVSGTNNDAVATFSCTYILEMDELVCEGDSVVVGSSSYKTTGNYRDTFGFGSCQTIVALNLMVQAKNHTLNIEICEGDSYVFNGNTYNSSGTDDAAFSSSMGCDSIVTLVLNVVSSFDGQVVEAAICEGDIYSFGGSNYSQGGTYTKTFTASGGCDSTVVLNLDVFERHDVTIVDYICQGDFYVFGTSNYIESGIYTQSLINSNNCDSTVTLDLTVLSGDEPTSIDKSMCEGEVFVFGSNTYSLPGTYEITYTTSGGCQADVSLNLSTKSAPTVNLNETICEGTDFTFEGDMLTETGVYTATYIAASGCDSTIILNLTVNANGTDTEITESICEGETYELAGILYNSAGVYEATMTPHNGCGDSTVTLTLSVDPATELIDAVVCQGEVYSIGNNNYDLSGTYVNIVETTAGCETEVTLNLTVMPTEVEDINARICAGEVYTVGNQEFATSGEYIVKLETVVAACDSVVNLDLVVTDPISILSNITHDAGQNSGAIDLRVFGGTSPYTFSWSNGKASEDIQSLATGTYTVSITDANGCQMIESFEVSFSTGTNLVEQGGFSASLAPNLVAPGITSRLLVENDEAQTFQIRLVNANGQLIQRESMESSIGQTPYEIKAPVVSGMYLLILTNDRGQYRSLPLIVK